MVQTVYIYSSNSFTSITLMCLKKIENVSPFSASLVSPCHRYTDNACCYLSCS